eukprot:1139334-Pelagomonas_calceolata.AAC.15
MGANNTTDQGNCMLDPTTLGNKTSMLRSAPGSWPQGQAALGRGAAPASSRMNMRGSSGLGTCVCATQRGSLSLQQ